MLRRPGTITIVLLWVGVLTGCTAGPPATPSPTSVAPVPVPTSVLRLPGQPPTVVYGTVPDAALGVPYEYHLYAHCGIRTAEFDGRSWVVQPGAGPAPSNRDLGPDQYLAGVMTLIEPDLAEFTWPTGRAWFRPITVPQGLCA